jgi:transcriptional regulator with XRE-family HTH domain
VSTSDRALSDYIGAYLEELRERRELTREDVGNAVGVTQFSIKNYENGSQRIPLVTFLRICAFLKVHPSMVMETIIEDNNIEPL